ncbi:MAG: hypothetical protein Q7S04_01520 [Candidatus Moranbacteria bacterium]|nr:hypothetical protein [Candidatus Moranbacteria bacterium]
MAGIFSPKILSVFSYLVPLFAVLLGFYLTKRSEKTTVWRERLRMISLGSLAVIVPFVSVSFFINLFMIFKNGWGLTGLNAVSLVAIIALLLGFAVGVVVQYIIFIVFGFIGSFIAGKTLKNSSTSPAP